MALVMGVEKIDATILNGASLSDQVNLGAKTLVGIAMPAAWTAAALTFQISIDDGATWLNMQTSSAELSYTAAASQYVAIDPALWRGVTAVKVRSGTSGAAVNQAADRTVSLVVKPII